MKSISHHQSRAPAWIWLGYVVFVIYGSLVPLEYKARTLTAAWAAFQQIPFLKLGIESRADWIANGVLYIPVGVFTMLMLRSLMPRMPQLIALPVAAIFCSALAVSVEFTQLFFPPRTVSLNDLMAEVLGSLLGLVLVARFADWFAALFASILHDTRRLTILALDAYVVAYLAFALFPFDLLLSASEISDKWNSNGWGWLLAGESKRFGIVVIKLAAEMVLTLPFGWLLVRLLRRGEATKNQGDRHFGGHSGQRHSSTKGREIQSVRYGLGIVVGLVLGTFLEVTQFFIASGISQGLSVGTRVVGVCVGMWMGQMANHYTFQDLASLIRRMWPLLALPYLVALLEINGWLTSRWQGLQHALEQLAIVNFLPFYYHYFTTEAVALFSLAAVFMSYLPVGVLGWSFRWGQGFVFVFAVLAALVLESGKLFIKGLHPDPTNLLIAGAASCIALAVLRLLSNPKTVPLVAPIPPVGVSGVGAIASQPRQNPPNGVTAAQRVALLLGFGAVAAWVYSFPGAQFLVAMVLSVACVAVWISPRLVFGIVPAALPAFDLAPWSGRFFFDEFDVLVLCTLAIALVRAPRSSASEAVKAVGSRSVHRAPPDGLFVAAAALLILAIAISTVLGLLPLQWPDSNAFNSYFSPYNALRITKGAVWACLFWWLAKRCSGVGIDPRRPFAWGMAGGLALTVIVIIWERLAFPGLWDFSSDYRVTGPFSATHTGGAYVDCFIAAAIPFLIVLALEQRHWLVKIAGFGLVLASTYALVVTFSRGGYFAFAVAVAMVLLALVLKSARKSARKLGHNVALVGLALAMLLVALPVFMSNFMQSRVASASADLDFRAAHWADSLAIRDPDLMTSLFGMGVGRFPEAKYWRSTLHPKVATYRLLSEQKDGRNNTFLRLDAGESIGLEQFVAIEPDQKYWLKFDVRPSHSNTKVTIPICEKWLLTSFQCVNPSIDLGSQKATWRSVELQVDTRDFALRPWPTGRPVKLSVTHSLANSTLDFDNLHLLTENGAELLQNGDFAHGLDHWFFSVAGTLHAHWRTHNLFVGTLFDQGWFGLVAMVALLGLASVRAAKRAWRGDVLAAGSLAALCGFVVGGLFDTQIDAPRFLLLLLLLAWASGVPEMRSNGTKDRRGDRVKGLPAREG